METSNEKKTMAPLWFWSQPENGMSVEDGEAIAKEALSDASRKRRYLTDSYIHIVFM